MSAKKEEKPRKKAQKTTKTEKKTVKTANKTKALKKENAKPESKVDKTESEETQTTKKAERNTDGTFSKGHQKKGGRKPGTPNRYGNIRERLKDILMPYLEFDPENDKEKDGKAKCFATDLMAIDDPKDRIDAVSKILPFVVPKYSSTTISADADRPVDDEQLLLDLDEKYTKKELSINIKSLTIVNNDAPSDDYDPDDDPDFSLDDLMNETE